MQTWNEDGQGSLFAPDGCAGKMCPAHSAQGPPRGKTSALSWRRSSELKAIPFMSLDLTPGHGNLLGESYWEMTSPLLGGSSMLNTGPAPLREEDVYSLSRILQDNPPRKYYLSRTACLGILRRARERGKELPPQLKAALTAQAGLAPLMDILVDSVAFAANQRDEVRDLHDVAGALSAQPGMKQQTFIAQDCLTPWDTQQSRIFTPESKAPTLASADGGGGRNPGGLLFTAGFCAGASPAAGSIGYQEEVSPTLKASASGNMMPSILCLTDHGGQRMDFTENMTPTLRAQMGTHLPLICLNDQGGSVMDCSEDVAGTLRAQEHGHQPLVFDNHGQDTRFRGPVGTAQTVSASFGAGGNNQPLVLGMQRDQEDIELPKTVELYENHGIDARYTGPHKVSPTLTNRSGTGGNNLPLITQAAEVLCILGNTVDCAPEHGGHGLGIQKGIAYTLTSEHRHAVFTRQRSDRFQEGDIASTESAQQDKDATDLIYQAAEQAEAKEPSLRCAAELPRLIRRLTPLECERLQGFPDGWTDLPGASDSARYRALGNSVAIPCVEYIMRGIAMAAGSIGDSTSSLSHGH